MYDLGPVVSAAEAKLALIKQLEHETNELLYSPVEALNECLKRRQAVLNQLVEAQARLIDLCCGRDDLTSVIDLTCDVGSLPPELHPLCGLSLSAKAGINRINKISPAIENRLAEEKACILKNIESLNISSTSTANKYYRSVRGSANKGSASVKTKII